MRAAVFGTCLVDQLFPRVGLAALSVLRRCGVEAALPPGQTCCGQPFFNMGYRAEARRLALHTLKVLRGYDAVVLPSGSCASMIRVYYPDLFSPDDPQAAEVRALAARTWELTQFLVRKLGVRRVDAGFEGKVAYHDACHALRELRIHDEPRELIRSVRGCSLVELPERGACCGFGGAFSVKFAEISTAILHDKVQAIRNAGADVLVSTDSSCLMQMSGAIRTLHIAELLAGGGR